jgi:hypothetical protein
MSLCRIHRKVVRLRLQLEPIIHVRLPRPKRSWKTTTVVCFSPPWLPTLVTDDCSCAVNMHNNFTHSSLRFMIYGLVPEANRNIARPFPEKNHRRYQWVETTSGGAIGHMIITISCGGFHVCGIKSMHFSYLRQNLAMKDIHQSICWWMNCPEEKKKLQWRTWRRGSLTRIFSDVSVYNKVLCYNMQVHLITRVSVDNEE